MKVAIHWVAAASTFFGLALAIPYNGPAQTVSLGDVALELYDPIPTKGPEYSPELLKRFTRPDTVCGYDITNSSDSFACASPRTCIFDSVNSNFGCVLPSAGAPQATTACYGLAERSRCTGACTLDPEVVFCNSAAYPACVLWAFPAYQYKFYECGQTSQVIFIDFTPSAYTTNPSSPSTSTRSSSSAPSSSPPSSLSPSSSAPSSTSVPPSPTPTQPSGSTAPAGAIAGGVVGGIAVLGLVAIGLCCVWRRKKQSNEPQYGSINTAAGPSTTYAGQAGYTSDTGYVPYALENETGHSQLSSPQYGYSPQMAEHQTSSQTHLAGAVGSKYDNRTISYISSQGSPAISHDSPVIGQDTMSPQYFSPASTGPELTGHGGMHKAHQEPGAQIHEAP